MSISSFLRNKLNVKDVGKSAEGLSSDALFSRFRDQARPGLMGHLYKILNPEGYKKSLNSAFGSRLNPTSPRNIIKESINSGDFSKIPQAQELFSDNLRSGGKLGMNMATKTVLDVNKKVAGAAISTAASATPPIAKTLYGAGSAFTEATVGVSLAQIGIGGGIATGLGLAAMKATGISGEQVQTAASQFHQAQIEANKPTYGYSELGQSTQGLLFGLNNRRTR